MTFDDSCGCDSHENGMAAIGNRALVSRRKVLGGMLGAGIVTMVGSTPASAALRALAVPGSNNDRVLINLFLRGGADGLNMVVPHGDADYYRLRNSIAQQKGSLSDLDGFFGLNKAFQPLYPLYRDGEAAFVHAIGSPIPKGSHFAAMDDIDFAFGSGGWMERALTVSQLTAPVSALTISQRSAPALRGTNGGVAFDSLEKFRRSSRQLSEMRSALESMYRASGDGLTAAATLDAFSTVDTLSSVTTGSGGNYPNGKLAAQFREAATLIKADIGVRMISIGFGGWDHHSNEVSRMEAGGKQLSEAIAAFQQDLGSAKGRVMTVVMSEFGRTARENGSGGTDHGYGTVMTLVGGGLSASGGGRVHLRDNKWVGLSDEELVRKRNLAVSTDFRAVLSEVLENHMGISDDGRIFPGYTAQPLGIFSGNQPAPRPEPTNPEPGSTSTTAPEARPGTTESSTGTQAPSTNTAPGQTAPGQTAPGQTTPAQTTPGQGTTASSGTGSSGTTAANSGTGASSTSAPGGGKSSGAISGDRSAPLVVNTPSGSVVPSTVPSVSGVGTNAATELVGSTSSTTAAALGSAADPNLALAPGVQQSVSSGGLGIAKILSGAAASTFGAAALLGGFLWRRKSEESPLVYLATDDAEAAAQQPGYEAWVDEQVER